MVLQSRKMEQNASIPIIIGNCKQIGDNMLRWTITFLVIAIIAAILGFGGIAGAAAGIAEICFYIFLILFVVSLIFGRRPKA